MRAPSSQFVEEVQSSYMLLVRTGVLGLSSVQDVAPRGQVFLSNLRKPHSRRPTMTAIFCWGSRILELNEGNSRSSPFDRAHTLTAYPVPAQTLCSCSSYDPTTPWHHSVPSIAPPNNLPTLLRSRGWKAEPCLKLPVSCALLCPVAFPPIIVARY